MDEIERQQASDNKSDLDILLRTLCDPKNRYFSVWDEGLVHNLANRLLIKYNMRHPEEAISFTDHSKQEAKEQFKQKVREQFKQKIDIHLRGTRLVDGHHANGALGLDPLDPRHQSTKNA